MHKTAAYLSFRFFPWLFLAGLAGCSTNPVTGRDQIVSVPAAQVHADIGFATREMAHVIARHDEEDSGVRIVSSALRTVIPGFSLVVKFLASALGGGALMQTWAAEQRREADDIAVALLERTGRSAAVVAKSLAAGLKHVRLPGGEWSARYSESAARVALLAEMPPRYADFED